MLHVADERKKEDYRRMKEITNERAETEEIFANTGPYHHTTNQNVFFELLSKKMYSLQLPNQDSNMKGVFLMMTIMYTCCFVFK